MATVVGIDAYAKGWVAVVAVDGAVSAVHVFPTASAVMAAVPGAAAYGIDIPIGLPSGPTRVADALARRFVGPRSSSVFNTPPRSVIEAPTYEEARHIASERFGKGVSSQSYRGLRAKLLEVDRLVGPGSNVFEVHPEVSFRALSGEPLAYSKRSWNGQMERRDLLSAAGLELPRRLDEAGAVPVDDVLDAAAVAWSAGRVARGEAGSLPDPPEQDERGRAVAIWY